MEANTELTRQTYGCGWAPIAPERLRPFVRVPQPLGFAPLPDQSFDVCPGYLVHLPAVHEIARARNWKGGNLRDFCDGKPTEAMMLGIEIVEAAVVDLQNWIMTPRSKGGGAEG